MDAEIKYENCEAIWDQPQQQPSWNTGNTVLAATTTTIHNTIENINTKQNFDEYKDGGVDPERVGMGEVGCYDYDNFKRNSVNSMGSANSENYDHPQQYPHDYESKGRTVPISGKLTLKGDQRRRVEYSAVFSPPFFRLQEDHALLKPRAVITARCLSCNVLLRGNKYVSSNFLKHLKRLHPHMYRMYDKVKLLKNRGLPTSSAVASVNSDDHNDHAYFDASTFLSTNSAENAMDDTAEEEEEHNLEHTENSETLFSCNDANEITKTSNAQTTKEPNAPQVRVVSDKSLRANKANTMSEDSATTRVHLSNETIQIMAQMLDEKLKGFVTKTELNNAINGTQIQSLEERMSDIESDSDAGDLQSQINSLSKECEQLRSDIEQSKFSKRQLQKELQRMDSFIHRRYLFIRNIKIEDNAKVEKAVEELFSGTLQLPHIHVKRATLLTKSKVVQSKKNVLVELQNERHAKEIYRNCSKLRNTGIYIESELSQFALKRKEKLLILRKEILRRNADCKVVVRQTFMIIQNKRFYWDEVEGLCVDSNENESMDASMNALKTLERVTGLDLKEFLNVLKNYDVRISN